MLVRFTPSKLIHVSLVVFPECDPSIIYGVYDTLWAAGWLWGSLNGQRTANRCSSRVWSAPSRGHCSSEPAFSIIPHERSS